MSYRVSLQRDHLRSPRVNECTHTMVAEGRTHSRRGFSAPAAGLEGGRDGRRQATRRLPLAADSSVHPHTRPRLPSGCQMGADGPRWTRSSIRAATAGTAAGISATAGFSSAASRGSATAERTPGAAMPTRTASSHGKERRRRSHARPRPSGPDRSHSRAQAAGCAAVSSVPTPGRCRSTPAPGGSTGPGARAPALAAPSTTARGRCGAHRAAHRPSLLPPPRSRGAVPAPVPRLRPLLADPFKHQVSASG